MKKLLYQGSVKNLYEVESDILFEYSDRYSLFDWGEMPDHLDKKGEALALMGALFFKAMDDQSIPHHFLHLANEIGEDIGWKPTRYLKVKKIPVVRPLLLGKTYNYSFYQTKPQSGLVPLEVIFRFGVGKGSSLLKRAKDQSSLLKQWGLKELKEGDFFEEPLIDFSTKLEKGDRYITHTEARELAGLCSDEFKSLMDQTKKIAYLLKEMMTKIGLELWDGKVEWAFTGGSPRSFMLVDSIGLDELRLVRQGVSLSKEFLREYYRATDWFGLLERAKMEAAKLGSDFKTLCTVNPPHLPLKEKEFTEAMYLSFTNDLSQLVLGKKLFPDNFTLDTWIKGIG